MIANNLYSIANGFGFTFSDCEADCSITPEDFIIEVSKNGLSLVKKDTHFRSLLKTWIYLNSKYLRPEILRKKSKDLSIVNQQILGSFCMIAKESDVSSRWESIIQDIHKATKGKVVNIVPMDYPEEGLCPYLLAFGIRYRKSQFQDKRKFMNFKWLINNNIWMKNRFLMTTSVRADLFSYLALKPKAKEKDVCEAISISRSSYYALKEEALLFLN